MSTTRERLLEATRELLTTRGADVGMADVAGAVGLSRQAVYLHFPSRAALLLAVVRHMDDQADIRARAEEALGTPDAVDALAAFVRVWLAHVRTILPVATVLLAARGRDSAASAAWDDRMAELRSGFHQVTRRLAADGRLRPWLDAGTAADLAWAMTSVPVWQQLTADSRRSARAAEEALVRTVVTALTDDRLPTC